MITWIQRTFQHHFRAIFGVLLVLIIVSFIFVTNASSGLGGSERQVLTREFFGYNLGSPDDQARLYGDASLSATLQLGYSGLGSDELQQYAFQRVAALHLANQLHIPAPTKLELEAHIKTLRAFAGEGGQFDATRYNAFRSNLKAGGRFTEGDVGRVIGDDIRVEKAQQLLAGPGYVLDHDVQTQLTRAETSWTLGLATVDYSSYNPGISPNAAELAKFYGDNTFRYEVGPRAVVSGIVFANSAYLAAAQVTEAEVRALFDSNPANFQKPANNPADPKALKPAEAGDYALVRNEVEATLKNARAQQLADKAASDLSLALFEGRARLASDPAALDALLASRGLKLQPIAPFTREAGPAEFDHSPDVAAEAFKLSTGRIFSDAVSYNRGVVVLIWKETLPAHTPAYTEVTAKVTADYIENEKRKRFVELGRTLKSLIESRVKAGDTFEQAAAAAAKAGSVTITAKQLPAFTPRQPAPEVDYSIFGALERLNQGQVSDMIIAQDKGLIVYAVTKKLPDLSPANPQYAAARAQIASMTARLGASQYINELITEELKKSEPKVQ